MGYSTGDPRGAKSGSEAEAAEECPVYCLVLQISLNPLLHAQEHLPGGGGIYLPNQAGPSSINQQSRRCPPPWTCLQANLIGGILSTTESPPFDFTLRQVGGTLMRTKRNHEASPFESALLFFSMFSKSYVLVRVTTFFSLSTTA